MTKQFIYRVVEVSNTDITYISRTFCATKESAKAEINGIANMRKRYGCEVEAYKGHRWDSVAIKVMNYTDWLAVEKVTQVTDCNGYKSVLGFVTYEMK